MEGRENIYSMVAQGIERVRKLCGYNQQEFADFLGVGKRTYAYWIDESGDRRTRPSLDTIQLIMDMTGFPIDEFFPRPINPHQALATLCEFHGLKIEKTKLSSNTDKLGYLTTRLLSFKNNPEALEKIEASLKAIERKMSSPKRQKHKKNKVKKKQR